MFDSACRADLSRHSFNDGGSFNEGGPVALFWVRFFEKPNVYEEKTGSF